jgi:hypothetical protein
MLQQCALIKRQQSQLEVLLPAASKPDFQMTSLPISRPPPSLLPCFAETGGPNITIDNGPLLEIPFRRSGLHSPQAMTARSKAQVSQVLPVEHMTKKAMSKSKPSSIYKVDQQAVPAPTPAPAAPMAAAAAAAAAASAAAAEFSDWLVGGIRATPAPRSPPPPFRHQPPVTQSKERLARIAQSTGAQLSHGGLDPQLVPAMMAEEKAEFDDGLDDCCDNTALKTPANTTANATKT